MEDDNKTKEQLVIELTELRSQNDALKRSVTGSLSSELVSEEAGRYAESIVETVRETLLVLDADMKIILATARVYGATIWTQDSDFKEIDGVRYIAKNG